MQREPIVKIFINFTVPKDTRRNTHKIQKPLFTWKRQKTVFQNLIFFRKKVPTSEKSHSAEGASIPPKTFSRSKT